MVQRAEQTGSSNARTKKVPQSNGKAAKVATSKGKTTDTTMRTADAPTASETRRVVSNVIARLSPDERRGLIAEAAYLRAERRGFANGSETDDWLAAEAEIDARFPK
jgi:hypothetical protein